MMYPAGTKHSANHTGNVCACDDLLCWQSGIVQHYSCVPSSLCQALLPAGCTKQFKSQIIKNVLLTNPCDLLYTLT